MLSIPPIPLQELQDPELHTYGVQIMVKRDDLIHPQISGNKWRKLKYNLAAARQQGHHTLLTFGGAYSNHILAVAAAGELAGFTTIGIIRGEQHEPLNSTLQWASNHGMVLHYIDRESYRQKSEKNFQQQLIEKFGPCYIIPEGGSNGYAVQGCAEIIAELPATYNYITTACGTGGTLAGLIAGLPGEKKALGFAALKGAQFLYDDVQRLLEAYDALAQTGRTSNFNNWEINLDYHFGGYAKSKPELLEFIKKFITRNSILIEPVYTGKMFFGLYDLVRKGYFKRGETIVALHTGGLRNF
jgi:1-aminocyclopropane-1-carboxylate deaminase